MARMILLKLSSAMRLRFSWQSILQPKEPMSLAQPLCPLQATQQEQCDTFKALQTYVRGENKVGVSDGEEQRHHGHWDSSYRESILKSNQWKPYGNTVVAIAEWNTAEDIAFLQK